MLPLAWMTQLQVCPSRDNYVEAEQHNPSVPEVTQYLPVTVPVSSCESQQLFQPLSFVYLHFQVMARLENSVVASLP